MPLRDALNPEGRPVQAFMKDPDGTITVFGWETKAIYSPSLITPDDAGFLDIEGDVLKITVANGTAEYRIIERDDDLDRMVVELVSGHLDDGKKPVRVIEKLELMSIALTSDGFGIAGRITEAWNV